MRNPFNAYTIVEIVFLISRVGEYEYYLRKQSYR